jgi:LysR family transcriptional regulator, benzoate and cis,cis-muconate-responsive activator of ben and cat genes
MADVEVRELRYFLAVAEELNFSRAAERLGIAQPPLSRAIRELERRIGATLFERTSRRVSLTPAGRTLLAEAVPALDAVSAAARRTRRAATPRLVVTAKPGIATELLRGIVEDFAREPDAPAVDVVVSGFGQQSAMLRDGRADLALIGTPYDRRGIHLEELTSEPRVAALPAGHELVRRRVLYCRDLAGLPFPDWPGADEDERDYWSGRDVHGGPVAPGPAAGDSSQIIEAVALGRTVALIPASLAGYNRRSDIVYRPVRDASPYGVAIAWPEGRTTDWHDRMVKIAVDRGVPGGR